MSDLPGDAPRKTRGGARPGAGRPKGSRRSELTPHTPRPPISRHKPQLVTVKFADDTWNLRSQRCFAPIRETLRVLTERKGFRVVHFSVQRRELLLLIEATDRRAMSNGMRALLIRVARGLNQVMGSRGRRVDDRYQELILRTPTEVHDALRKVLGDGDAYSSLAPSVEPLVLPPTSRLLREAGTLAV